MSRRAPILTAILAVASAALAAGSCGEGKPRTPAAPASTLDATLGDPDGDGALERGPGEPLRDRTASSGRRTSTVTWWVRSSAFQLGVKPSQ